MSSRPSSVRQDLVIVLDSPELGEARPIGVLTRWPGPILSVAFQYARSWLDDRTRHFAIDPSLPLAEDRLVVPDRRAPAIRADTEPDAWGRALLVRREGRHLDDWPGTVTTTCATTASCGTPMGGGWRRRMT